MNNTILNIADPIISRFAPSKSLLRDCLIASNWDDEKENSISIAHYNQRLVVSTLLRGIADDSKTKNLVKLLTSQSKALTKKDVVHGFKSAEIVLKDTLSISQARISSMLFRKFVREFSSALYDKSNASDVIYESILLANSKYQQKSDVSLFEIKTKGKGSNRDIYFIDPDFFPTLFQKSSVLHYMLQNIETSSKTKQIEYSVIVGLKSQLRDIDDWPDSSDIKTLLNTPLHIVKADSINSALVDYERRLFRTRPDIKLNQPSTIFRQHLFTYALTTPELTATKTEFKTNFNKFGKLNFKPSYTIKTIKDDYSIDSFLLPSLLPTESLGEICFTCLEKKTKHKPADKAAYSG